MKIIFVIIITILIAGCVNFENQAKLFEDQGKLLVYKQNEDYSITELGYKSEKEALEILKKAEWTITELEDKCSLHIGIRKPRGEFIETTMINGNVFFIRFYRIKDDKWIETWFHSVAKNDLLELVKVYYNNRDNILEQKIQNMNLPIEYKN